MKRPWYERNPGLLRAMEKEVPTQFPDLRAVIELGAVVIRGALPVIEDGEILDRFQIEIALPPDFPDSIPVLREVGGRIPWHEAGT